MPEAGTPGIPKGDGQIPRLRNPRNVLDWKKGPWRERASDVLECGGKRKRHAALALLGRQVNDSVVSLNWVVFRRKGFSPPARPNFLVALERNILGWK